MSHLRPFRPSPVRTVVAAAALLLAAAPLHAQVSVTTSLANLFEVTRENVMATAEMLDEEMYAFRPTEEVRSIGELFGHIANAQYLFCSAAAGEASPNDVDFEESATTKAELIGALEAGFDYCQGVYDATDDETVMEPRDFFTGPTTVAGILAFNSAHNYEHYGNLVTYMRINGIVPPSSM